MPLEDPQGRVLQQILSEWKKMDNRFTRLEYTIHGPNEDNGMYSEVKRISGFINQLGDPKKLIDTVEGLATFKTQMELRVRLVGAMSALLGSIGGGIVVGVVMYFIEGK